MPAALTHAELLAGSLRHLTAGVAEGSYGGGAMHYDLDKCHSPAAVDRQAAQQRQCQAASVPHSCVQLLASPHNSAAPAEQSMPTSPLYNCIDCIL